MQPSMRFLLVLICAVGLAPGWNLQASPLRIDQLLEIRHPSDPVWSPDGKHIVYLWDRCDVVNLFVVAAKGDDQPRALTHFAEGKVANIFWSQDGNSVYFVQGGKLWSVPTTGGEATVVWAMPDGANSLDPSPDGTKVAAAIPGTDSGTELVVRNLATGSVQTLARNNGTIYRIRWSPDAQRMAFIGDGKLIPHDNSPSYSGEKLVYRTMEYRPGRLYVISASGGEPKPLGANPAEYEDVSWAGNSLLVFERQSPDFKDRSIVTTEVDTAAEHVLHIDHEANFWSLPEYFSGSPQPSPDGAWIAWISDTDDGWDHLYIAPASGGAPILLTSGHNEAWRPTWSHDSRSLAFDINSSEHPGDRRIGIVSIANHPERPTVRYVTAGEGADVDPNWSRSDDTLVYQHSDWENSADLYAIAVGAGSKPVRLTDSMPDAIDKSLLVRPKYVTFPGADDTPVPGWLFVPKNLDRSKKHAAIVWIHGDGINQNYDGWHVQRNYAVYYSFHQFLLQQGYVVFAPDYRGSIGYGSKWRSAVYMDVGGKDAEDASRAGDYLATLPYIDANRIGVWGLSYGGFFTLIAVTRHPLLFRSAIDVAGVVDYRMYYDDPYHGDWTASRIGTPQQNPQVYDHASPLSHIGDLQRPLLILHGTADVNVPFIESVRLVDEALKKKKGDMVSFMMYPGEFHYFSREQVLSDAWRRVDRFFAETLHPHQ